jgi:hypothetical protein
MPKRGSSSKSDVKLILSPTYLVPKQRIEIKCLDLGAKTSRDQSIYGVTRSLQSIAARGLHQCYGYDFSSNPHETDNSEAGLILTLGNSRPKRKSFWQDAKSVRVSKRHFLKFIDYWTLPEGSYSSADHIKFGLLYASPTIFGLTRPEVEPMRAWKVESFVLNRTYRLLGAIQKGKSKGFKGDDLNSFVQKNMELYWKNQTLDTKGVSLNGFVPLLVHGPTTLTFQQDWIDVALRVLNYYIPRLCPVSVGVKSSYHLICQPTCQLGALWAFLANSYWFPILEDRSCMQCGADISDLPKMSRYCKEHQSDKYRKQRQRSRSELRRANQNDYSHLPEVR